MLVKSCIAYVEVKKLLNEQGIPSACEYDVDGVLTMLILSTLTNHAPFMGNTNPIVIEDGKLRPLLMFRLTVIPLLLEVFSLS